VGDKSMNILVGKPERKILLGGPRRCVDNIKIDSLHEFTLPPPPKLYALLILSMQATCPTRLYVT
jgi:hypothetical protein